jgi:hypothetical protein
MQNKAAILNFPLKDGKTPAVSKFSALLHECVWLYMRNWSHHIKVRHPEMTLTLIAKILSDPDSVFKPSKSSKEFYYQKTVGGAEYRVIIKADSRCGKSIVTAYPLTCQREIDRHEAYCSYARDDDYVFEKWLGWYDEQPAQ